MTRALLSLTPLPGWAGPGGVVAARAGALPTASGLLLPHDGLPVADVRDRPERWVALGLVAEALRRNVPVLGWGSGAALLGRALGAAVVPAGAHGGVDWSPLPRGAVVHAWGGEVPLHWSHGRATAWADVTLPVRIRAEFLAALPGLTDRQPGSPLEVVGGPVAVQAVVTEFYARARQDALLGPVFAAHVRDWPAHLRHVTAFWVTMLGGAEGPLPAWRGNLNGAHAGLGIGGAHLRAWLALWAGTARDLLPPDAAEVLVTRAAAMGARLGRGARGTSQGRGA